MTDGRDCPVCLAPGVPPWRATCGECWHYMPAELRTALLYAWRFRVIDQRHYQETLAAALIWGSSRRRPSS
jgi:hypothetical protein